MPSIELKLCRKHFAVDMTDMSKWLTRKQINPSRFTYFTDRVGDSVRVRVDFASHSEADLFSDRFSGPPGLERQPSVGMLAAGYTNGIYAITRAASSGIGL